MCLLLLLLSSLSSSSSSSRLQRIHNKNRATENGLYIATSATHSGAAPNTLHGRSKLLHLRPALYILMQKAVILTACRTVREFLAEQWLRSAWSVRPVLFGEPARLASKMHYFSTLFGKELYMFRRDLLSIIRSLNTVFTAIGICHTGYVDCLLARSGVCPKHVELFTKIVEK